MRGMRLGLWQWNWVMYLLFHPKAIAKIPGTMINRYTNSVIRLRGFFAASKDFVAFLPVMINLMSSF